MFARATESGSRPNLRFHSPPPSSIHPQIDDAWYCDDALGFKWANATATGGCMSEEEAATPAGADSAASLSMMAQGSVTWVCAQQARRRSVGEREGRSGCHACIAAASLHCPYRSLHRSHDCALFCASPPSFFFLLLLPDLMVDTQYVMACQYGTTPDGQLIPPSMGDAPEQPSK